MSERDAREKRTAILKKFDEVVEVIKTALVTAGQGAVVRMKPNGSFVLVQMGMPDKTLLNYQSQDFFDAPYQNFKAYTHHVISIESDVVYDPNKNQVWKVIFDEASLIFKSNVENQTISIFIER